VRSSNGGLIAAQSADGRALDQAAFVELIEPVLPAAHRLAAAMLRSDTEAEDAVQEAVFKAWRHRERYRAEAAMKPWLLAIVANECRAMRRNRWRSVISWPYRMAAQPAPDDVDSGVGLRRAIHALPHEQRLVVVLRYYLDLPFEEVAEVLKISAKAAKSRTYRALQRLRLDPEVLGDE
jgi:RNA polymerase sigma-70 factor, ECF subfamily